MVKFSRYDTYCNKRGGGGLDFIFLITLGHDVNRISTNPGIVLEYTLTTSTWRKKLNPLKCCVSSKMKWEKMAFELCRGCSDLSIDSIINNQHTATKLHANRIHSSQCISVILKMITWQYAQKQKKCWKIYYSSQGFRENAAPKQLTNHNARNHGPAGLWGRQD